MTPAPQPDQTNQAPIVIRDRRKPNQFTTDNVIAREWLPILRVGDAYFFYSVYLSMANRETESSWGSLRTLARYLQCGVDLIIRGNKLLEICELIHIETGNQHISNEYYVLDPPSLTDELAARMEQRLQEIAEQETGKNWQSWVKQVQKALSAHRSLSSIWEEKRAKRGGRPVKTIRPQNPDSEPQAGFVEKGASESQPGSMWDTTTAHVAHNQDVSETHAKQEKQTNKSEQEKERESSRLLLSVKTRCQHLGLADATIDTLVETYSLPELAQQLDWLPLRHPRDPAAMFISAVQGCWSAPAHHDPDLAQEIWQSWTTALAGETGTPEDPSRTEPVSYALPDGEQDARSVWSSVLADLQTQMPRASFDTWLTDTRVLRVDAGSLIVAVRDEYTAEWLRTHWLTPIQRIVAAIVGRSLPVLFEVSA